MFKKIIEAPKGLLFIRFISIIIMSAALDIEIEELKVVTNLKVIRAHS